MEIYCYWTVVGIYSRHCEKHLRNTQKYAIETKDNLVKPAHIIRKTNVYKKWQHDQPNNHTIVQYTIP